MKDHILLTISAAGIMIIQKFENLPLIGESIQVKLPRLNLILDPRANEPHTRKFDCRYHADGITVTLTRIDRCRTPTTYVGCSFSFREYDRIRGINRGSFTLRVYDPETETVPRFDTTTYTYMGINDEIAPANTIVAIIDQSVNTIKKNAFFGCSKMKKFKVYHA